MLLGETPTLTTARLVLTPLAPNDAMDLAAAMSDAALFEFIGGEPPTVDELERRLRRYAEGPKRPGEAWHNWAIRLGPAEGEPGRLVGHLQATVADDGKSSDIAWLVGTPWQSHGYATEAAIALCDWLVANGVERIDAHVAPANHASARVAAKAGLEPTKERHDGEVVWRRRIGEA